MAEFFEVSATRPLGEVIRKAEFNRDVTLVTDPSTMVPYRLVERVHSTVWYGDDKEATQDTETVWTFNYEEGPSGTPGAAEGPASQ